MTTEDKRHALTDMCHGSKKCGECNIGRAGLDELCSPTPFPDMSEKCINLLYDIAFPAFPENSPADSKSDNVNRPAHYQGAHECIEVMQAMLGVEAVKAFCRCNAFKYRFRADRKNGAEDIKKAEWYEDYLMKLCDSERKEHK